MTDPAYAYPHQLARKAAMAALRDGSPCPICGRPMWKQVHKLHYDHEIPVAVGGGRGPKRLVHAFCNMSRGGKVGARITNGKRKGKRVPARPLGVYDRW